jgi:hypothetical protein
MQKQTVPGTDPDQMAQNVPANLDLHCSPRSEGVSIKQRVKFCKFTHTTFENHLL